jgi:hypothetical protein
LNQPVSATLDMNRRTTAKIALISTNVRLRINVHTFAITLKEAIVVPALPGMLWKMIKQFAKLSMDVQCWL